MAYYRLQETTNKVGFDGRVVVVECVEQNELMFVVKLLVDGFSPHNLNESDAIASVVFFFQCEIHPSHKSKNFIRLPARARGSEIERRHEKTPRERRNLEGEDEEERKEEANSRVR